MKSKSLIAHLEKYKISRNSMSLTPTIINTLRCEVYENAGEWARNCRVLSRSESSETGAFNPDRTPYFKHIYEAIESGLYKKIVLVMGAQMSKTEFLLNEMGFLYDSLPSSGAFVLPNKDLAKRFSRKRVAKLLANSTLKRKVNTRDDNVYEKWISGCCLRIVWATSASQLCSDPLQYVFIDELDRCEDIDEGNIVVLSEARTATYANPLIIMSSTPTIEKASRIVQQFELGTQEKFYFLCLGCFRPFLPILENLKWPKDKPEEAYLECPNCQHKMYDKDRELLTKNGIFIGEGQTYDLATKKVIGNLINTDTASFWIYGLCSPWKKFQDRASAFYDAVKSQDHAIIQAVVNVDFGQTYRIKGDAPEFAAILSLQENYDSVPDLAQIVLAAVDVQKDRFYFVVRAFAQGGESWLLSWGELFAGDTEDPASWTKLEQQVLNTQYKTKAGLVFPIHQAFIDSNYRPYMVYDFCMKSNFRWMPAKGKETLRCPIVPSNLMHKDKNIKIYYFMDGFFKERVHGDIKRQFSGDKRTWHIVKINESYAKSLVAEQLITTALGVKKWIRLSERNDYLDCEKMTTALAHHIGVFVPAQGAVQRPRVISKGISL